MLRSYISEELSAKTTGMHEGSHLNYVVQCSKCTTFINSDIIMYEESNNDQDIYLRNKETQQTKIYFLRV